LTETGKETKRKKEKREQRQRKKREREKRKKRNRRNREDQNRERRKEREGVFLLVTRGEKKGKRRSLSVGYQRREGRSFAYWLVRYLWHSKQAGFAGISFSFSFLAVFQSWCLLIVCFLKKNMFLLLSRTCVFFLFWQQVASLLLFRS